MVRIRANRHLSINYNIYNRKHPIKRRKAISVLTLAEKYVATKTNVRQQQSPKLLAKTQIIASIIGKYFAFS